MTAWLEATKEFGSPGVKRSITLPERVQSATPGGTAESDRKAITPWEEIRAEFGQIRGDEELIKNKWVELEKFITPFIYWLIK